jgi:hypothetical protein
LKKLQNYKKLDNKDDAKIEAAPLIKLIEKKESKQIILKFRKTSVGK